MATREPTKTEQGKPASVGFTAIARIVDKSGTTLGFRLVRTDDKGTKDAAGNKYLTVYPTANAQVLKWLIAGIPFTNLAMTNNRDIKGVGGDLSRYTAIDNDTSSVVGDVSYVILSKIANVDAYKICDPAGRVLRLKTAVIADKCKLANGKVTTSDKGTKFISAISGEYEQEVMPKPKVVANQPAKQEPTIPGVLDEGKTIEDAVKLPEAPPSYETMQTPYSTQSLYTLRESYIGDVDLEATPDKNNPKITLADKLLRARLTLKAWSPFHFVLYSRMTKIVSTKISTMGVNTKEWVINPDFLAELTEPELMFVIYHELGHIFYGHTARRGSRDPELWNVAADLVVNAAFAKQFDIKPGEKKAAPLRSQFINEVAMLSNCLYDAELRADEKSVEEIYNLLIEKDNARRQDPAYKAGIKAGKKDLGFFNDHTKDLPDDFAFDYRLGSEAAIQDIKHGYTLQSAYTKGYNDAQMGTPAADTTTFAPREQEAYAQAYTEAKAGLPFNFPALYNATWGAYWRGTDGFVTGYRDVVNSVVPTYQDLEDGVIK